MNLKKANSRLLRIQASYENKKELAVLARDLGHEFPRNRLELLNEFRASMAEVLSRSEYVCGYLDALREITAAYSAAIRREMEEKELSKK